MIVKKLEFESENYHNEIISREGEEKATTEAAALESESKRRGRRSNKMPLHEIPTACRRAQKIQKCMFRFKSAGLLCASNLIIENILMAKY
jgi:hypothetical protein